MKMKFLLLAILLVSRSISYADEGMWLPMFIKRLNIDEMKKHGLRLSAEEIYSVNKSSLKDALVQLGGGFCTAEVISGDALVLTNHHCAYSAIQSHSSVQSDYLSDGFWAMNRAQELPNEGLTASFLVRMDDVTGEVLAGVTPTMDEVTRARTIGENMAAIKQKAEEGTHYNAVVKSFFEGNEFYIFVYETFRDVRLVGAPPSSIGKFGGETDNWMWPRHTGDFALLRVYTGPDGKPAEYSTSNIPMKPKHFLPVSLKGYKEGDFAMIMGYPGSTDRYLTSYGVQLAVDLEQPTRVAIREKKLDLIKEDMDANPAVRIKYAAKWAQISNYWKYFKGQSEMLKERDVYNRKLALEQDLAKWIAADANRQLQYGTVLQDFQTNFDEKKKYTLSQVYLGEAIFGSEALLLALQSRGIADVLKTAEDDPESLANTIETMREDGRDFFKDYNMPTDRKVTAAMLEMYSKNVPKEQQASVISDISTNRNGDFSGATSALFAQSIFTDSARYFAFLNNPSLTTLENDSLFNMATTIYSEYRANILPAMSAFGQPMARAERLFIEALRTMNPDKKYYPDANSTMRLSYGDVGSYEPRDGVHYKYWTTAQGILEKADPNDPEFIVPEKLQTLIRNRDFGQYASKDGDLWVCFITDNDITGGNSGSPVIDGRGQLIGLAFDGNWEAMSGDIFFEKDLQRTISVDIRYVLFIIDKYAGAGHLISEMELVK